MRNGQSFGGQSFGFSYHKEDRELRINMAGIKALKEAVALYPQPFREATTSVLKRAAATGELQRVGADTAAFKTILRRADVYNQCGETHDEAAARLARAFEESTKEFSPDYWPDSDPQPCNSEPCKPKTKCARAEKEVTEGFFAFETQQQPDPQPVIVGKRAGIIHCEYKVGELKKLVRLCGATSPLTGNKFVMEPITIPASQDRDAVAKAWASLVGQAFNIFEYSLGQVIIGDRIKLAFADPIKKTGTYRANKNAHCELSVQAGQNQAIEARAYVEVWNV